MTFDFSTLSKEEKDAIAKEIVERIKDITFMNLYQEIRDMIEDTRLVLNTDESIEYSWSVKTLYNDFLQIVGRMRREHGITSSSFSLNHRTDIPDSASQDGTS